MYFRGEGQNTGKLKVLHLASFAGNIGDIANHAGFYQKFREKISSNVTFNQIEIRKFYKNRAELKFDEEFIALINRHDLFVIGGGGFFDLQWDYSSTGTTIDFSKEFIGKITTPVLINGIGYHEYGEVKERNVEKFENFLATIGNRDDWVVSVRNDGSFNRIEKRYGILSRRILKIPDHGSFFNPRQYDRAGLERDNWTWLGLCISNDLFSANFNKDLDISSFNERICKFINDYLDNNLNSGILFFPHAQQDLTTLGIIIGKVKDKHRREKIAVAPFYSGSERTAEYIFDMYRACVCIIGMRFHSNLCAIGMGIPSLGLAGHGQISSLYDELGLSERCIKLDDRQFVGELWGKLNVTLQMLDSIKKQYAAINVKLNCQSDLYYLQLREWLNNREKC